ncbi:MAG: tetratricopeptide repeat protein [Planctomycetota bacterium]|jgi:tetratricopeptide (TPR) repeat protein
MKYALRVFLKWSGFSRILLRAKLENMATEKQKDNLEENTSEVLSDRELFAGEVHEELSERETFAGDEDFYKRLADSNQDVTSGQPAGASKSPLVPIRHKYYFSNLQKVLVVSIVAIVAILLYALLKSLPKPAANRTPTPTSSTTPIVLQTSTSKPPAEHLVQKAPQQIQKPESVLPSTQPLSLKVAETFYLQKDYGKAYDAYHQLHQTLPKNAEEELVRDFLQLRMALCMKNAAEYDQAKRLFRMVSKSDSPVVRVVANYHRSLLEVQKKQYLNARTRAYQAIALISAVVPHLRGDEFSPAKAGDKDWALTLQRDCHFLVTESMTRYILSLCDADKDLPGKLWSGSHSANVANVKPSNPAEVDPFTNLNEAELRRLLNSGSEQLSKGLLSPQIQKLEQEVTSPRYSVVCHGAPIEELLARFAANTDLDISWSFDMETAVEGTKNAIHKRPVSLYLPEVTPEQFVTIAAGHVGLLARLDEKGVVNIFNPSDYSSLSEHVSLLTQDTISLWQRFLLAARPDERIPNAHFALGLLQAQKGQVTDAIAEYKLVANRFSRTSLAPFALLHSSKLKINLRDYLGAREDLKQLVEQYPDIEFSDQACLYLADATMKARLYDEAARLYSKVYHLGLSLESQTASTLGAGRCSYEKMDYEAAAKWLTRYISLAADKTSKDLYLAYFLLGKTNVALRKPQQACDAFQSALGGPAGGLSREKYVETVLALVKCHMEQEHFIDALDVLENIRSVAFSQKESINILLLKSEILRAMGLVDKAIVALGDRAQYLSDSQLKARISFELTNCYIAKGNLEHARTNLAEILVLVEPGPFAHEIALELANVCLKLGQNSQAISVCSQLLNLGPTEQIKQKALNILATAYTRQKNYDRAALSLLGQWNGTEATPHLLSSGSRLIGAGHRAQ